MMTPPSASSASCLRKIARGFVPALGKPPVASLPPGRGALDVDDYAIVPLARRCLATDGFSSAGLLFYVLSPPQTVFRRQDFLFLRPFPAADGFPSAGLLFYVLPLATDGFPSAGLSLEKRPLASLLLGLPPRLTEVSHRGRAVGAPRHRRFSVGRTSFLRPFPAADVFGRQVFFLCFPPATDGFPSAGLLFMLSSRRRRFRAVGFPLEKRPAARLAGRSFSFLPWLSLCKHFPFARRGWRGVKAAVVRGGGGVKGRGGAGRRAAGYGEAGRGGRVGKA